MKIKVLGSGCPSCKKLLENTKEAVKELNIDTDIEYITDLEKIMASGVMSIPALIINDNVVSKGKVLSKDEITKIIKSL